MTPTQRLVVALAALAAAGLALAFGLLPAALWNAAAGLLAVLAAADLLAVRAERSPLVSRIVPQSLAIGAPARIELEVENRSRRAVQLRVHDVHPIGFQTDSLPLEVSAPAASRSVWHYTARPTQRGAHRFEGTDCVLRSPLGLWWHKRRLGTPQEVRVYPNFAAVSRYALLAMEDRLSDIGVRKRRRRGTGSEFQQLREFRQGDSLRQVDWRATARTRKLISKEYQDERDQSVIFLLDCGRRMRAQDGPLSHFDEALNAVLLLAYVALAKGDAVGIGTFGGSGRWFAPVKGQAAVNRMLNQLYDLEPSLTTPDYARAAVELLARHKKHAMVIIVTNLRDEDTEDMRAAVATLGRRHLVLVASTRERAIDDALSQPVRGFGDALRLTAAHHYRESRQRYLNALRASGVGCVDVLPAELSVALVNTYLALKARGAA